MHSNPILVNRLVQIRPRKISVTHTDITGGACHVLSVYIAFVKIGGHSTTIYATKGLEHLSLQVPCLTLPHIRQRPAAFLLAHSSLDMKIFSSGFLDSLPLALPFFPLTFFTPADFTPTDMLGVTFVSYLTSEPSMAALFVSNVCDLWKRCPPTNGDIVLTQLGNSRFQIMQEMNNHLSFRWTPNTSLQFRDHSFQSSNILNNCTSLRQVFILSVIGSHRSNLTIIRFKGQTILIPCHRSIIQYLKLITLSSPKLISLACKMSRGIVNVITFRRWCSHSELLPSEGLGAFTAGRAWKGERTADFTTCTPAASTVTLEGFKELGFSPGVAVAAAWAAAPVAAVA